MYSVEQIEAIWKKIKPLYFKVVSGANKTGIGKFDGRRESKEDIEAQSDDLFTEFQDEVALLIDGTYTVIMRTSESSVRNEKVYTFKVGEGIGNTGETKQDRQQNRDFGGGGSNMMLFQMMMQQQQANTALIMQMLEKNHDTKAEIWQRDMELFKLQQGKSMSDKVFGLLEKPHIAGIIGKLVQQPAPVAIGRAEAPKPPNNVVPSVDQMKQAERLQAVFGKIREQYPGLDPDDVIEQGLEMAASMSKT